MEERAKKKEKNETLTEYEYRRTKDSMYLISCCSPCFTAKSIFPVPNTSRCTSNTDIYIYGPLMISKTPLM